MYLNYKLYWKNVILIIKVLAIITIFFQSNSCSNTTINGSNDIFPSTEIALLLPLEAQSDQTNELATNLMNSARLAARDLDYLNLKLSIYPTSGDQTRAMHAAKAAVENGAQIIVGPLFSKETQAVKNTLKDKNIKIISLSNDPTVAGGNVFIMGTTFQNSASRLVQFALSKDLRRIAVIGPKGELGVNGIRAAENAIKESGAILTTSALYPLDVKGISEISPRIYTTLIKGDSQAIIFTDSPTRGLGFITEQLYQQYEKNNNKLPQFMGLTRWDSSKQLLNEVSINKGWFVIPDQRFKKQFQKRYSKVFGTYPSEVSSLSYDAIALIGGVLKKNDTIIGSEKFNHRHFFDQNGFVGVNGIFRFRPNRTNDRSLSIVEVHANKLKIIDQAQIKF